MFFCVRYSTSDVYFLCIIRAFDTLAKVLHPGDGSAGESLEATMQLMSGDQSGPVVELEGPLLSDSHIPFKVKVTTDHDPPKVMLMHH